MKHEQNQSAAVNVYSSNRQEGETLLNNETVESPERRLDQ